MCEQDIERLARDLGAERARQVDPDRMAQAVMARLASGERVPRRPAGLARWGLALAAVLTIVVATGRLTRSAPEADGTAAAPVALTGLDSTGLNEVMDSLLIEAPASEYVGWGIGTMNADELERLLAAMEG